MKDELIFADPPPMLKVAGVAGCTFDCDLDCNERSKKARTKVFVISKWIIGFINLIKQQVSDYEILP
jgi:hypothetical protein